MSPDREIESRSATDLPSAPPPNDPPGMQAIRRFFRHPFFQGIWLWLRTMGRGLRASWKWLEKNAGPIARGIEQAGNVAVRASQGAVKVGHAAGEIGGKLGEWGRDRRDATGARLRRVGQGMRRFGRRATWIGTQAEEVAESVEDLGEGLASLVGNDGKPEHPARRPEARKPRAEAWPHRRLPRPVPAIPPASESTPEIAAPEESATDGELSGVFRERIRPLGKRKRSKPLRALILDICAHRKWTTVGELATWLDMDTSNLQRRHLRPLLKSGQLRLRYPQNKSHPEQGYRAAGV